MLSLYFVTADGRMTKQAQMWCKKKSSNIRIMKHFLGKVHHSLPLQVCVVLCRLLQSSAMTFSIKLHNKTLCQKKRNIYTTTFFFFFFLKCLKFVSWIILINIHILVITSCLGTSDEQQMIMFSMKSPNIHFSFVLLVCFEARSTCKLYSHYGIRLLIS